MLVESMLVRVLRVISNIPHPEIGSASSMMSMTSSMSALSSGVSLLLFSRKNLMLLKLR